MKLVFIGFLLLVSVCTQAQWTEIDSPLGKINAIEFVKVDQKDQGFAVGDNGLFLKSDSSLNHWTKQPFPSTSILNVIEFKNANEGLVGGDGGLLARTTDGGATWTTILSGMAEQFSFVQWLGGDVVIACTSGGKLYRSTNSGLDFSLIFSFTDKTVSTLAFSNSQEGYVGGYPNFFMKTTDGGQSWLNKSLSISIPFSIYDITTYNGTTIVVTGNGSTDINKISTNSGNSWQNLPLGSGTNPQGNIFRFKEDGTLVNFTSYRRFSVSSNQGQTWVSKRYFYAVEGTSSGLSPNGYKIAGNRIFVTPYSFYSINLETTKIQGIRINNSFTNAPGSIVPDRSEFFLSSSYNLFSSFWDTKNNAHVFVNPPGQQGYLRGGVYLDSNISILMCDSRILSNGFNGSTLFRYHKDSQTYDSILVPYAAYGDGISRLVMPDSQNIYGVRSNRNIVKSYNRGHSWQTDQGSVPYTSYQIVSRNFWLSWSGNSLKKSNDEGISWSDLTFGSLTDVLDCYFSDSLNGILILGSKILKTSDGGASWSISLATMPTQMTTVSITTLFISPQRGFIFRGNSRYLETTDSGNSWTVKYYPFSNYLSFGGVDPKTKTAYVACNNQSMYMLSETITVQTKENLKARPLNLFPNPVESQMNVGLDGPFDDFRIFMANGKETSCPFTTSGILDCRQLQPGIYFLKLRHRGVEFNGRFMKL